MDISDLKALSGPLTLREALIVRIAEQHLKASVLENNALSKRLYDSQTLFNFSQ